MKKKWKTEERRHNHFQGKLSVFLIVCGIIILLVWGFQRDLQPEETPESIEKIITNIRFAPNVWIMNEENGLITVFEEGEKKQYRMTEETDKTIREKNNAIADLVISDEKVVGVFLKSQSLHGVVHDWGENYVSLEGYGRLELEDDYKGYRLYGTPGMIKVSNLCLGEDCADFIVENGKICAIFLTREEKMEKIKVLIRTAGYAGIYHESINLQGEQGLRIAYQEGRQWKEIHLEQGVPMVITPDSAIIKGEEMRLKVIPDALTGSIKVSGLNRAMGDPRYSGELEILAKEEGLVLINELPVEEYLYHVIPSEMPASYPMEALKAQAICARTYAYGFLGHAGYPELGAHVDDSVRYQVYYNLESQERTTQAVKDTYGLVLRDLTGDLAETYYYSTSCGWGTDESAWGSEKKGYLKGKKISRTIMEQNGSMLEKEELDKDNEEEKNQAEFLLESDLDDYECEMPWYRWSYSVDQLDLRSFSKRLSDNLETEEEVAPFQHLLDLCIKQRGGGGVALCLEVHTDAGVYEVYGEHGIRSVLCDGIAKAKRNDGLEGDCPNLLPSAFFLLETSNQGGYVIGYQLKGGGLGHGIGMSQNAARKMAEEGKTAEDILAFFYDGCYCDHIFKEDAKESQS